ncbi:zinc finger protein, putative [Ixodes scapularis]|uniref:Zinc finger protein, putative n=1 Tax=Ixodes scapularis TaxID=6945 RepID=B7PMW1_IXOSC|nr:zinc finger protein, putative [Ixodes scapularis]|eukprot:XP_002435109.1 zinc finger protein, putative [Ixodes scapularis]
MQLGASRPFKCAFCNYTTNYKGNLPTHERKHTGERPFLCGWCPRRFGNRSNLTRHVRLHRGETPRRHRVARLPQASQAVLPDDPPTSTDDVPF